MKAVLIALALTMAMPAQAQTLRARGQRVMISAAEAAAGFAKSTGTAAEQAQYTAFVTRLNNWCTEAKLAVTKNWYCAEGLVIAHKMDPVTFGSDYADGACELLRWSIDTTDGVNSGIQDSSDVRRSGNQFRWYAPYVAALWDEFGSHCDTVDTTIGDKYRAYAADVWDYWDPFAVSYASASSTDNNIGVGVFNSMLQVAIAAYDASTYTTPAAWISSMKTTTEAYLIPCLENSTAANAGELCYGGSGSEGMSEYGPETRALMLQMLQAWKIGTTDVDYFPSLDGVFPRYLVQWMMAATSPTGPTGSYVSKLVQPFYWRDVQTYGYMYFVQWDMMIQVMRALNQLGDTTYYNYALWWIKTYMPQPLLATNSEAWFEGRKLLWLPAGATGTDYHNVVSTDYTTPFQLLSRSDWTEDATWVGIFAMNESGQHYHGDAGNFGIYRKGKWLTREIPGYGTSTAVRAVSSGASHNVLTLNGHASYAASGRGTTQTALARMARRTGGAVSSCNDLFCAARFELTPAYTFTGSQISTDVSSALRDFVYLKPDIVIVSDRIKYVSGLNALSIFHVQSEKAAASISGNRATIANASQRLHVNAVFPSTYNFATPLQTTFKVVDIRPISSDAAFMFLDGTHLLANGNSITISGLSGAYSSVNGTYTVAIQSGTSGTQPYSDGVAYNGERIKINSVGTFAGLPTFDPTTHGYGETNITKTMRWNDPDINPTSPNTIVTHAPYRLDVQSGRRVNEESFLVVMQATDSTNTPITVATLTSTTSNATGAAFTPPGGTLTEVIAPTLTTPTFPMSITRTGDPADHYVLGMTPGTTYKVSDSGGVTTINTSGAGTDVVANNAGILNYQVDDSIQSPSITLVATPASLAASCVNGGSNPANQTIALTVTGDGGEAAVSFSDDSSAISETLSGGAAPQNTPQTMTVAFGGCSGLAEGVHNLTISVTSGTTYVVNSPLTIPVTVTVTANPLIAASPASANFTATVSGANPADQTVTITRTVSGDLGSITDDAAWLTVTPSSATGITSQDLTLAVDIAGLDPGQHTATITVASSGASNTPITIPVLLALDNPPAIGVEPRPGTTMIQIPFRAPSRAACTIRACTTAACSSVVASASDGGGHPIRIYTLTGLTAATTYTVQTVCGTEIKARQVTTRAATGGPTITLPIDVFNAVGADNIVVDYGADDTLSETAVNGSCSASRCTATITWSNAFRLLWFQITFRDSGNNVLKTETVKSRSLIPE